MSDQSARQVEAVFQEALALFRQKNESYGDSWRRQGWRGNLSRILEKADRLRTMLWNAKSITMAGDESTRQTALDMLNSLAFFIINTDGGVEWGNETPFNNYRMSVPDWAAGPESIIAKTIITNDPEPENPFEAETDEPYDADADQQRFQ